VHSTVLVTTPDRETALMISRELVRLRLAACANMFPVHSVYRWEDEVMEEGEHIVLLKTRYHDFQEVKQAILELHPYEVPCIVGYDIDRGHDPYLDWIRESTERI
jgi:periplasmic divalent cation tolerance protein